MFQNTFHLTPLHPSYSSKELKYETRLQRLNGKDSNISRISELPGKFDYHRIVHKEPYQLSVSTTTSKPASWQSTQIYNLPVPELKVRPDINDELLGVNNLVGVVTTPDAELEDY